MATKIYGPEIGYTAEAVDTPAPVEGKAVPAVTVKDPALNKEPVGFTFEVAPYDLATTRKLTLIEVVCLAQGFQPPADPNELLTGAHPFGSADTSDALGGEYRVTIPKTRDVVPAGVVGKFQVIYTLDD